MADLDPKGCSVLLIALATTILAKPVPATCNRRKTRRRRERLPDGQFLIATTDYGRAAPFTQRDLVISHERSGAFGLIVNGRCEARHIAQLLADIGQKGERVRAA